VQSAGEDKLSDAVLAGEFAAGDTIIINAVDGKIALEKGDSEISLPDDDEESVEEEALPTT
jgi:hypothetical protein